MNPRSSSADAAGIPAQRFFAINLTLRQLLTPRLGVTIGVGALAAGLLLGLPALFAGAPPGPGPSSTALPVAVVTASHETGFTRTRLFTGTVAARRRSQLGFELAGTVSTVAVDEGERVAKGQILAELDDRSIEAEIRVEKARLSDAEAKLAELEAGPRAEVIAAARARVRELDRELAYLRIQQQRQRELLANKVASQARFDEVHYQVQAQTARLANARSKLAELEHGTRKESLIAQRALVAVQREQLARLRIDRDKLLLVAPFDGRVAARHVDEGRIVSPGTPVLTVVEEGELEAEIGVTNDSAGRLEVGKRHRLRIGAREVEATILRILPDVDTATRTVAVVFGWTRGAMDGTRPGQIARLALDEFRAERGMWLPATALTRSRKGLWAVWVAHESDEGTRVERREVEVLHTDGERVYVRGMVTDGELVVANGTHRLAIGQLVHPVQES